jgi:hypothetical protein
VNESLIVQLSDRQLRAYNAADLDEFCRCYHREVQVIDAAGVVSASGLDAFRERYRMMFDGHSQVSAYVTDRMVLGPHIVEREFWSRVDRVTNAKLSGEILVRYTEHEGLIRWAQFFRDAPTL